MPPGFPGVTAGGDGPKAGGSAERMRRLRQRRAAERREAEQHARTLARREAHEQLPLMPVAAASDDERPKTGRPAGSVARHTAAWRQLILTRYRSPLIAMAEAYSRPVEELAKELGCTRREAFEIQMRAAAELAPFVHSKMPIAVQGEGLPQVGITLAVSAEAAQQMGMVAPPVPLPKTVVNQALGEDDPA
jgi:hypothetical protein